MASYMNHKLAQLSELPGHTDSRWKQKHTAQAWRNIADDYFKAKHQAEVFEDISELKR